jgi:K+-sensing histidine kinase KdpD
VEDLKAKVGSEFPKHASATSWKVETANTSANIDPQLLQDALLELFRNAFEHLTEGASIDFIARTEGDNLVLTLYEPKPQFSLGTEQWGREPLQHVNRGHYGLGLNRARTIIEGHGGKLNAQYDSTGSRLVTNVTVPLAPGGK